METINVYEPSLFYENPDNYKKSTFVFSNVWGTGSNGKTKTNPYDEVTLPLSDLGEIIDIKPKSFLKVKTLKIPTNVVEYRFQDEQMLPFLKQLTEFAMKCTESEVTQSWRLKKTKNVISR